MDTVKVKVKDLLKHVRENKKKHNSILRQATRGYWKECRGRISAARKAVSQKDFDWREPLMQLRVPEDHSDDYNSAIRMLEMCAEPIIEISREDFEAYVMNKWHWRSTFIATSVAYGATGPTGTTGPTGPSGIDF
jgi:hypothetical protein